MRQIKFRYIWRRKEDGHIWGEIVPIGCLEHKGDSPFVHEANIKWELVARNEYTGLTDKEGKDIYEGDVLKCGWYYGDDFGEAVGEMEFSNQVVKFVVRLQGSGFDLNVQGMENAEIIGNIYQNPDLIKE